MKLHHVLPAVFAITTLHAFAVQAADAPPGMTEKVRGTLVSGSAEAVTLRTASGEVLNARVTPATRINAVSAATFADIHPDSYIGTAAATQPDGTLQAIEVHIFAPSLRGSGDGHRPWQGSDGNQATMTNGTVGQLQGQDGRQLVVRYANGEQTVRVPAGVPVVRLDPGTPALLLPGAKAIVVAAPGEDGQPQAQSIAVGVGGLTPPM
ncbi:hypothetical protein [Pseudomonas typographi]|uniref:DUF5666 domain-containing protein n=1 Tax=Pseudomonas typographi TaxID=2715964 RepID=A0ABR7Z1E1_9PSED|nr:hypothetical protein [Pseudomonas typographi]MBD1551661.1 hypothetical protein [Pseudomonas typographi]MBD1587085.1 hypothetical protein [Pseudomonas typographi]MBD1599321.1 hypothetical protein [Pseudomonas typographi]